MGDLNTLLQGPSIMPVGSQPPPIPDEWPAPPGMRPPPTPIGPPQFQPPREPVGPPAYQPPAMAAEKYGEGLGTGRPGPGVRPTPTPIGPPVYQPPRNPVGPPVGPPPPGGQASPLARPPIRPATAGPGMATSAGSASQRLGGGMTPPVRQPQPPSPVRQPPPYPTKYPVR